jgi:predicted Zn-dependent peptidase
MIDHLRLKNNLNLLLIPKIGAKSCIIGFVAPTGLVVEEKSFPNGINYLVENMLWTGTLKHPNDKQLTMYLESLAVKVHHYVDYETIQVYLEVPSYNQFKAMSLLADIIQGSLFETVDIEKQKRIIKDRIFSNHRDDNMGEIGRDLLIKNMYLNTNYTDNNFTKLEDFMSIRREDILDFINHQFEPTRCHLIVSGNYDDEILDTCEQEWGNWVPRSKRFVDLIEQRDPVSLDLPIINYRQRGSLLTEVHMGFIMDPDPSIYFVNQETGENIDSKSLKAIEPDYIRSLCRLQLLDTILGYGSTSRLWSKSVNDEGLFLSISSEVIQLRHGVYLLIFGLLENGQFTFGMESILKVLEGLRKSTLSINEMIRIRENLKGRIVLAHENLLDYTLSRVDTYINTGFCYDIDEVLQIINSIQASEIRNLALDLFKPEKLSIFINGTAKETKIVNKLIDRYLK